MGRSSISFTMRDWMEEVLEELDCGEEVMAVYAKVCRRQGKYERRPDKGKLAAAYAREQLKDPKVRRFFERVAKERGYRSAFQAAMRGYLQGIGTEGE